MTDNSQRNEDWTTHNGRPVYWLAPEFWNPVTGIVTLLLPEEIAHQLSLATCQQRTIEFLKLQGDPRYCTPEVSVRMKRLMVERLGTETPWRGVHPHVDTSAPHAGAVNDASATIDSIPASI